MNEQVSADPRLEAALSSANYRITFNLHIQNARVRLQEQLVYSVNGGIFKVTPELISFTNTLISTGRTSSILLDSNSNPVEVDLKKFLEDILTVYDEGTNAFLVKMNDLKRMRNIKSLVEA